MSEIVSKTFFQREHALEQLNALCKELCLSPRKATQAVTLLLGANPDLQLPQKPRLRWNARSAYADTMDLNPLEFYELFWATYADNGLLTQAELRRLDKSLFDAMKGWCKNRNLNPTDYLPPPDREKRTRPPVVVDAKFFTTKP